MANKLKCPDSFVPLNQVSEHPPQTTVDLVGIVTDIRPPFRSAAHLDMRMTFRITSPDLAGGSSIDIAWFGKNMDDMPQSVAPGDVLLARRIKRTGHDFNSAANKFGSIMAIFQSSKIAAVDFVHAYESGANKLVFETFPTGKTLIPVPNMSVQLYVMHLKQWAEKTGLFGPASNNKTALAGPLVEVQGRSLVDLSAVRIDKFYKVVVQIKKVWMEYDRASLYVTDFTENPFFYDQPAVNTAANSDWLISPKNTPLPGKYTLQITLFPPHSEWASSREQELTDAICVIDNLNIKLNKNGDNLEGKLHGDHRYPDKVDIQIIKDTDARAKALLARRKAYDDRNTKVNSIVEQDTSNLSKNQKKRLRQQANKERERLEREALELQEKAREQALARKASSALTVPIISASDNYAESAAGNKSKTKAQQDVAASEVLTTIVNPNGMLKSVYCIFDAYELVVFCTHPQKPCQTIEEIMKLTLRKETSQHGITKDLPFINIVFKWQVRVLDYKPDRIVDFAQSLADSSYNRLDLNIPSKNPWEWGFWLRVEDAHPRASQNPKQATILVNNKNAQYLLNMDACDLRKNSSELEKLKSRLFVLWGEVDEAKRNASQREEEYDPNNPTFVRPSNRPFQCVVEEYGVKDDFGEWTQIHRLTGTTIREN